MTDLRCYPPLLAKLTCPCVTDAGRRHETLGSETKDFTTTAAARVSAFVLVSQVPILTVQCVKGQLTSGQASRWHHRRTTNLGNLSFVLGRKSVLVFAPEGKLFLIM